MRIPRDGSRIAVLLALSCISAAQAPCPLSDWKVDGPPFFEAWVDPVNGSDDPLDARVSEPDLTPSVADARAAPFLTIQAAIDAVHALVQGDDEAQGIVHLGPGIYEEPTQTFPIDIKNRVNLQGVGARHCILRLPFGTPETILIPFLQSCECFGQGPEICKRLQSISGTIIMDFSGSEDPNEPTYSEMVDGLTFQGGTVQVYCRAEATAAGRISNCVFEMYEYPENSGIGPNFGILLVHDWNNATHSYAPYSFFVLNNTFIQGWQPSPTKKYLAKADSVAICDVGNPLCETTGPLKAVGHTNVANNLFRSLGKNASDLRYAMMGVSSGETQLSSFDCNMFNGGVLKHAGDTFALPSSVPYEDPAFVGEMLTNFTGASEDQGRDWRVLPGSSVIDQGVPPYQGALFFDNEDVYYDPSSDLQDCGLTAIDTFDFDGEGYGNRRVMGDSVDIGFDEFELLIVCGFGNESIAIPQTPAAPCYPVPSGGVGTRKFIVPGSTALTFKSSQVGCPSSQFSIPPGAIIPPVIGSTGVLWSTYSFVLTPPSGVTYYCGATAYTPPDGSVAHCFGLRNRASQNSGVYVNLQVKQNSIWSNLQTILD